MPEPDFGSQKDTVLTFDENKYFKKIRENSDFITEILQLGKDEAGVLDKKINPETLYTIDKVIFELHNQDSRNEAELKLLKLATENNPDVAIAILRQSFRIRNNEINELLVRMLTDLCQSAGSDIAREAIREATGSELQRLSQLADEVFLNIGKESELLLVAMDFHRTLNIRIRACLLLIKRHRSVEAVPVAFKLFVEGSDKPSARIPLEQLSRSFGLLETIDDIQEKIIVPLLDYMERYQKEKDIRRYPLMVVKKLHKPVLDKIRGKLVLQIQGRDMWLALTLRECAMQSIAGTQLMLDWMGNQEIDDHFRLRLSRRIKNKRVMFPQDAKNIIESLVDELPEDEWKENLNEALSNSAGVSKSRKPKSLYIELLEQYQETGNVENQDLWDFRFIKGSFNYIQDKSSKMDEDELKLLLLIIYDEGYKGHGNQRIDILIGIYSKFPFDQKREALQIIYNIAKNEPRTSKPWQNANGFLAEIVDGGDDDSELARQYWKKLGKQ